MPESRQERIERLRQEAHQLDDLTRHPGWLLIRREVEKIKERDYKALTEPVEVSLRRFDFDRGKLAGMQAVLGIAEKAMSTFTVAEKNARAVGVEE